MKKILFVLIILFIIMMNGVSAVNVEAGKIYEIDTISPCYGNAKIFVDYNDNNTKGKYIMGGCVNQQDFWLCECSDENSLELIFQTEKDVNDTFDFGIDFYVSDVSSDSLTDVEIQKYKRTSQYNNIIVGQPVEEKEEPKSQLPPFKLGTNGIIIIFIFIGLFILILLVVWRQFTKEENKKDDDMFGHQKKRNKTEKTIEVKESTKDEINDLINSL